ncbi:nuclear-pore anchor [Malania oleifera]|uniref:nuclear-pore anchor n=1 Tax=Malania oleifera TaxID=397392 RepID=UPI0025AE4116|nr:nuclear-pore anchor [Malania oleifera]
MPLFLTDVEYERCSGNAALVAEKADSFIRDLHKQLDTVKAQADAAAITAEQTCSLLEQKYLSLSSDFANLQSQNAQLNSTLEQRLSDLAQVQAEKHQLHLQSIGKDGEIERLSTETSELHKSKRQLMELVEQKDLEISEKNATIKSYLDKIVNLTDNAALREARLNDVEAELARTRGSCTRYLQEKELIERHNVWLNDELTSKVESLIALRKTHAELEAEMSVKLADTERQFNECSNSLKWNKEKVRELEIKLSSLQQEFCSSKEAAAASEEQFSAEISTVNKLVELYKESSEEWSKKATELEGVINALEMHLSQVENSYKEKLEKEAFAKKEFEKEVAELKEKLGKCESEMENSQKANELNLAAISPHSSEIWMSSFKTNEITEDNRMLVPNIPVGVSGTALAASLLRDGWSLAKMYSKYQEAVDALQHEQLGRKQAQAILERVLFEIEEKAAIILDERAEHERMLEAYSAINQKLQHSVSEQSKLEKTIQELKAELRRHERDYSLAQKEIVDLQKQVTVLLKECRDIQVRCGSAGYDYADDQAMIPAVEMNDESHAEKIISAQLLTFKDISGLVEQNVQLRSLVRSLSDQIENSELELKQNFEMEIKKQADEAASKVAAVLERSQEQGGMIESLHSSVEMYRRLYEEHKLQTSYLHSAEAAPEGRKDLMLLESSQEARKKAEEQAAEHLRTIEDDLAKSRSEIISLRLERDKLAMEANFARERLDSLIKESEHQRGETNGILARNVEFSQLVVDYQRKLRENSECVHAAEEVSRKLTMEVSVLKHKNEMLSSSESRALDEVRVLSERVHRLQASLDTIQTAEEAREEARRVERRKQEEYTKKVEREWAEAKNELQQERDNVRSLTLDREHTIKNAMRQVEEIGKELSNALRDAAAAEARAAVAEARYIDLEKKIKSAEAKAVGIDSESGPSSSTVNEVYQDLHVAREEMEKLKLEALANKDHMLQYKNIAQVNEDALKQMECAHESFKTEADKLKKSLESEILSLRERLSELEDESSLKSKEAASAVSGREEALNAALAEAAALKEEDAVKTSQIIAMEVQISVLKEDLEQEHQRWRTAQANYERQVILQSETIQELTKTSQALALLQLEASELHKLSDALKSENSELKARWESEKSVLDKLKNEAEMKYNEINEQNKILHSRLEALHIKLAEKERNAAGISSESTDSDSLGDSGLQNVVSYLRRSKEITETEISLLKKEKLRLQSQLENALKAAETAQASLHSERANSKASLFTEEEIKSLQIQVSEMNLLRESNMQLREENKHNFEECQKLRKVAHQSRIDIENLEALLKERQVELESYKKDIELHRLEKDQLEKRVGELLERCKNIEVEDFDRMKIDVQIMQESQREKDAEIEEIKKLVSEKQVIMADLERDLANSRLELTARENRINDSLQAEANLKSDVEKQKKMVTNFKKKLGALLKEKEALSKENLSLSKQLEDSKQGKRSIEDAAGEQAMKDKEKEKEARIQILEKTVERQREELRKEKNDHQKEKVKRLKTENTIADLYKNITQEKAKMYDDFEKHKQVVKRISDELDKHKHAKGNIPEGISAVQILSKTTLDDLPAGYASAVENFEKVAHSIFSSLPAETSVVDTAASGPAVPAHAVSTSSISAAASDSPLKPTEEKEKKTTLPKPVVETRKTGRKLVRPRLVILEEPQSDIEMSDMDASNNAAKLAVHDAEAQGNMTLLNQPPIRKRQASTSASDLQEETLAQGKISTDLTEPVSKKSRSSDSPPESAEGQFAAHLETPGTPTVEETVDAAADLPQGSNEEAVDAEKDEVEATQGQSEEPKEPLQLDTNDEVDLQNDMNVFEDLLDKPGEEVPFDDGSKCPAGQDIQQSAEIGAEREEGELVPDIADLEGGDSSLMESADNVGGQVEHEPVPASPGEADDAISAGAAAEIGEIASPNVLNEEKNRGSDVVEEIAEDSDKSNDGNDQVTVETEPVPEPVSSSRGGTSASTVTEVGGSKQASPSITPEVDEEKQVLPASVSSNTINIQERARERAMLRQHGVISLTRGRGRVARSRGARGGRGGRGHASGGQG